MFQKHLKVPVKRFDLKKMSKTSIIDQKQFLKEMSEKDKLQQ